MRGLVIGRFQPVHQGHVHLIRRAIEDCVNVVVGIGSSNAKPGVRNPFSLEERRQMIEAVFADEVEVVAVPDIHDPPNWPAHVLETVGAVDRVFGNDERTLALFELQLQETRQPGLMERERYQGTAIRAQIAEGDRAWRDAVPPQVAALLDEWDAETRLRRLEAYA